jgi:hypothetical protein
MSVLDTMMEACRSAALECVASGISDEATNKWLELFELHDPSFAARLRRLKDAPAEAVAAIVGEIVATNPGVHPATSSVDEDA